MEIDICVHIFMILIDFVGLDPVTAVKDIWILGDNLSTKFGIRFQHSMLKPERTTQLRVVCMSTTTSM